jgi:hypothetical protein
MNARLLTLPLVCFTVVMSSAVSICPQTVVTFDDLPAPVVGTNIPNAYEGLSWSNFWVYNAILYTNVWPPNGYYYGMVSASNVAYDAYGTPSEIDSVTNFNFFSAYLTGAWNSNLNIEVEGFNGAQKIYDTIVIASATNPTLFTFNYFDIDRLYFDSYGGEPAFAGIDETHFVMDNFIFEFIPEPSSLLLTALGAVSLVAFLKRKRA